MVSSSCRSIEVLLLVGLLPALANVSNLTLRRLKLATLQQPAAKSALACLALAILLETALHRVEYLLGSTVPVQIAEATRLTRLLRIAAIWLMLHILQHDALWTSLRVCLVSGRMVLVTGQWILGDFKKSSLSSVRLVVRVRYGAERMDEEP